MPNDELVRKNTGLAEQRALMGEKESLSPLEKKGQATHGDYKDVVKLYREKTRRAKAQLHFI